MINKFISSIIVFNLLSFLLISSNLNAQIKIDDKFQFEEFRQFDFWIGAWDVNLRVKQKDNSWNDEIKSIAHIYSILDGKAILELWEEQDENDYEIKGYSLRYYNAKSKEWELYLNWPRPNSSATGLLTGNFRHGRGVFESYRQINDSTQGINRYTFSDITDNSLRWDDSYSQDSGKTWTHQWIMEFKRKANKAPKWQGETLHTYEKGGRCNLPEFSEFSNLVGQWQGKVKVKKDGEWYETNITWNGYKVLDDCAVLGIWEYSLEGENYKEFNCFTYNTRANLYELTILDNTTVHEAAIAYGIKEDGILKFRIRDKENRDVIKMRYEWKIKNQTLNFNIYQGENSQSSTEALLNKNQ